MAYSGLGTRHLSYSRPGVPTHGVGLEEMVRAMLPAGILCNGLVAHTADFFAIKPLALEGGAACRGQH